MSDQSDNPIINDYDEKVVLDLIMRNWRSGEVLVSHNEILEFINQVEPINSSDLFKVLNNFGFNYTRIENIIYWKVTEA